MDNKKCKEGYFCQTALKRMNDITEEYRIQYIKAEKLEEENKRLKLRVRTLTSILEELKYLYKETKLELKNTKVIADAYFNDKIKE